MADMSVKDFADALRQMADNADRVAERHDVAKIGRLQDLVLTQRNQAERDADLIAELRKQVEAMGRSLDAISQLRKTVLVDQHACLPRVQILADALLLIGEDHCESFTGSWSCRDEGSGKTRRGGGGTAGLWCDSCVARDALERAGWTNG